jgi:hypothetical protein
MSFFKLTFGNFFYCIREYLKKQQIDSGKVNTKLQFATLQRRKTCYQYLSSIKFVIKMDQPFPAEDEPMEMTLDDVRLQVGNLIGSGNFGELRFGKKLVSTS